jgi:hypothetical protein
VSAARQFRRRHAIRSDKDERVARRVLARLNGQRLFRAYHQEHDPQPRHFDHTGKKLP